MDLNHFGGIPKKLWTCKNCDGYEKECKERLASWYPTRGYGPCPYWRAKPLTDDDF